MVVPNSSCCIHNKVISCSITYLERLLNVHQSYLDTNIKQVNYDRRRRRNYVQCNWRGRVGANEPNSQQHRLNRNSSLFKQKLNGGMTDWLLFWYQQTPLRLSTTRNAHASRHNITSSYTELVHTTLPSPRVVVAEVSKSLVLRLGAFSRGDYLIETLLQRAIE